MRTSYRSRSAVLLAAAALLAMSCGNGATTQSVTLASDQTFRFPIVDDVDSLDPGHCCSPASVTFNQNLFGGLYRFDDTLNEVPSIATGQPEISSDGLTYTFHLKKGVKFWNGDPVTSKDFVYSWNRTAYLNDSYASTFDPVVGGPDTEKNRTKTMAGLSTPDDQTIVAKVSAPAGYWLTELGLWGGDVVDQKVIGDYTDSKNTKNDSWWTNVDTAVGSGPYRIVSRIPKQSMEFAPVPNWWGGSTGHLKKIHVDVIPDQSTQVAKYESGGYDVVGYSTSPPPAEDVLRYKNDPTRVKQLHSVAAAQSAWLGFNFATGTFKGAAGHDGRQSLSQGLDRAQITEVPCVKGTVCIGATGGAIAKGLKGYLGDNGDPNARFDASAAKAEYQKWDPDGSRAKGLAYNFNTSASNKALAENLQSQWKANLGVSVDLISTDFTAFLKARKAKSFTLFRDSWGADYNHPQDYFDNRFVCSQAPPGRGNNLAYCNPAMDALVAKADASPLEQALPIYVQAEKLMADDAAFSGLTYGVNNYLIQPYVSGAGGNAFYDFAWTSISILKH